MSHTPSQSILPSPAQRLPRRCCLATLAWSLAALLSPASPTAHAAGKNIVLIVADDLGCNLGCYGDPIVRTPHLDALAASGTRFDRAFCTTASCSASRSVILTGLHNHANGQYGHQHAQHNFSTHKNIKSLPVQLAQAGYRTAIIGKLHVQPDEVYKFHTTLAGPNPRNGAALAEKCREFLAADDPRPFFLYFCPADPHRAARGFANDENYPGIQPIQYDPRDVSLPQFLPDIPEARHEWAEYYQAVSRLDQGVGKLLQILKETGKFDDTLVILTSDNGPPFPGAKTTVYDPGLRLPLIVRAPGQQPPGRVSQAMISWVDLAPTILDFAGIKPASTHGRSFLDILQSQNPQGWDEVFFSHTFHEVTMYYPMRGIRTQRYKYIWNIAHGLPFPFASDLYASSTWQAILARNEKQYGQRGVQAYLLRPREELYDLQADPHETVNLADSPQHAKILAELRARVHAWQLQTGDPWAVKQKYE